jgi:hypothetical protein
VSGAPPSKIADPLISHSWKWSGVNILTQINLLVTLLHITGILASGVAVCRQIVPIGNIKLAVSALISASTSRGGGHSAPCHQLLCSCWASRLLDAVVGSSQKALLARERKGDALHEECNSLLCETSLCTHFTRLMEQSVWYQYAKLLYLGCEHFGLFKICVDSCLRPSSCRAARK